MFADISIPTSFCLSFYAIRIRLVVVGKGLKECLRVFARWTEFWGTAYLDDIAAITTLPYYLAITSKEITIGKAT